MGNPAAVSTLPVLYRAADGYWRCAWYDDERKRHVRSFGRNRTTARNRFTLWLDRWRQDAQLRNPGATGPITIREAVARFHAHAEIYYRRADGTPTGEAVNLRHALDPVVERFGSVHAADFTPAMLLAVRESMLQARDRRTKSQEQAAPLSFRTINARVRRIRQAWSWMVHTLGVPAVTGYALGTIEPLKAGRTTAPVLPRVTPVAEQVVRATCDHLPPSLAAMVWLQWYAGARPGEVCRITTREIDTSGELWEYRPSQHKSLHHNHERVIVIGPRAQEALRPYLRRELDAPLFTPRMAHDERNERRRREYQPADPTRDYRRAASYQERRRAAPLPTRFREQWTSATYAKAIRDAAAEAKQPHWHPNQLRHATGARSRKLAGLDAAQAVLGHAKATTSEIYAPVDLDLARELMRRIG